MVTVASGQEFSVPSPPVDAAGLATGWNIYIGPSGNENLQNSTAIPIGTAFTLSAAPSTTLGIVPLGCSAFCHPLYRFQFLGGPNYSGASAGIGLHQWNPASSTWTTKFSVNGNGNLSTVGSGSFAAGMSVAVTGGTTTDTLTASGSVSAAQLTSGVVTSSQINKVFYADGYPADWLHQLGARPIQPNSTARRRPPMPGSPRTTRALSWSWVRAPTTPAPGFCCLR